MVNGQIPNHALIGPTPNQAIPQSPPQNANQIPPGYYAQDPINFPNPPQPNIVQILVDLLSGLTNLFQSWNGFVDAPALQPQTRPAFFKNAEPAAAQDEVLGVTARGGAENVEQLIEQSGLDFQSLANGKGFEELAQLGASRRAEGSPKNEDDATSQLIQSQNELFQQFQEQFNPGPVASGMEAHDAEAVAFSNFVVNQFPAPEGGSSAYSLRGTAKSPTVTCSASISIPV